MEVLKISQSNWLPAITEYVLAGSHRTGYVVVERPVAIVHRKTQVDEEVCDRLGYEIVESYNNAGTIVSNTGDILVGNTNASGKEWYDRFIVEFLAWLMHKGLNATFESNDILVDGYKVCGMCITRYGRIDYTGGIISMNVHLDDIKAICKKPMKKVPKGLSDYGITTEEVEAWFLEFCGVHERVYIEDEHQFSGLLEDE